MRFFPSNAGIIAALQATVFLTLTATSLFPTMPTGHPASTQGSRPSSQCPFMSSAQENQLAIGVIGDSYTGGTTMGGKGNDSWAEKLTGMLSANVPVDVQPIAYGGSGYINVGPFKKVFIDALPKFEKYNPDIIVIFGSINDNGQNTQALHAKAMEMHHKARILFPRAQLLVVGPTWHLESQAVRDNSLAVLSAARDAQIRTFDPLPQKWFDMEREKIADDGVHPTSAGHTFMAERIAPHIQSLIDNRPNPNLWTLFRIAEPHC